MVRAKTERTQGRDGRRCGRRSGRIRLLCLRAWRIRLRLFRRIGKKRRDAEENKKNRRITAKENRITGSKQNTETCPERTGLFCRTEVE